MAKKYEMVFHDLSRKISGGEFRNGDKLPSESQMMEVYSVSRQTVRQALGMLEEQGFLSRSRGKGAFVTKNSVLNTRRVAVIAYDVTLSVFPTALQEIENILFENGYTMLLFSTGGNVTKERQILHQLCEDPVDGIILYATESTFRCVNADVIQRIWNIGTKFVFMDSWYNEESLADIPSVTMADYDGAYEVVSELIARGCRSFGGVLTITGIQMMERLNGVRQAILDHGLSYEPGSFFAGTSVDNICFLVEHLPGECLLKQEVIISSGDSLTKKVFELLDEVPEKKTRYVVAFDELDLQPPEGIEVIMLMHASKEVGRYCTKKMLNLIRGGEETSVRLPWSTREGRRFPDHREN